MYSLCIFCLIIEGFHGGQIGGIKQLKLFAEKQILFRKGETLYYQYILQTWLP